MFTVKEMVIEFFWVLYMLATVAGVLSTFKLRQTKNPIPCLCVTFGLNVLLDLSRKATTKSLCSL